MILVLVAVADRIVKKLAMSGVESSWWIAHFQLFRNDRLVFSLPLSNGVGIGLMGIAVVVVLWWAARLARQGRWWPTVGALCVFLGAMSNLYDRLRFGYVIDWANFGPWWPIFNLADVMIAAGVVLLLWPWRVDKPSL